MAPDWLRALHATLQQSRHAVLVTVAHVEGSAPREAGTSFVVTRDDCSGTIGGGHLEFEAIAQARRQLGRPFSPIVVRYALGPSLGQCCGGVVWLLYERIDARDAEHWQHRLAQMEHGISIKRQLHRGDLASDWQPHEGRAHIRFDLRGEDWRLAQTIAAHAFPVWVFGAGHVGDAIVRALAPLEASITWIDSRESVFPPGLPTNVRTLFADSPEDEIDSAPPGAYFLVLTHSHDLDLKIAENILARSDFAFFGLIGSKSKRARFEHRLQARGLDTSRLVCPIGIPGLTGKAPAVIAIAVAAQLAGLREVALAQACTNETDFTPSPERTSVESR
jgi:xanthine dehydrogenase accessory factor